MTRPLITVAVLAYNRADLLAGILDSVVAQNFADYECVVSEDCSPERDALRAVVEQFALEHPGKFRFHSNERTLGFDGNLRQLIELAAGRYVYLLGNDDYVSPGAFTAIANAIQKHGNVGAILRAYTGFRESREVITHRSRYFASERVFAPGREAILACYRRFIPLSGIVLDRDAAQAAASNAVDGFLFYQQWLAANVVATKPLLYLPDFLAHIQMGSVAEFGRADAERARYVPGKRSQEQDLRLVEGLFKVGEALESHLKLPGLATDIRADFARYCYPTLALFARSGRRALWDGYRGLCNLGLGRFASTHLWFAALFVLGSGPLHWMITKIRALLGHTPSLRGAKR